MTIQRALQMYLCRKSRKSAERRALAWLRKLIHPYCWGVSDRFKQGFRRTTKCQILNFFLCLHLGLSKRWLPKPKTQDFMQHFTGYHILYFQANGQKKCRETLILIDIDCHFRGSFEGAVECVEWLRNNGFPGLFWCRSTNGRGIHAYLVVRKHQMIDVELDRALVTLERWLQYQHFVQGLDIEKIEVKGRPPVYQWGDHKYELHNVQMGSLAKVPVDLLDRPEELMATTSLSVARLNRLGLEVPRSWDKGLYCSTYNSLPIRDDDFGDISLEEIRQWQPETGSRVWCLWVERIARIGLVEDDSMGKVIFELAKWLLHVELADRDDRQENATTLLQAYVLNKHNGHITRLNERREAEVLSQVERIVASAAEITLDSAVLFGRIRQARESGQYRRKIRIAHLLSEGTATSSLEEKQDNCSTYYSLPIRDDVLPAHIEKKLTLYAKQKGMRRSQGEFPLIRFSRRLLNLLWDRKGSARLSTAFLTTWVTNIHQQNDFKVALRNLNLLRDWTGTYRAKSVSCLYSLTDEAMETFKYGGRQAGKRRLG
jgi:hypothetical protein